MPEESDSSGSNKESLTTSYIRAICEKVSQISQWKRYVPYLSGGGFDSGEYICQPYIEITSNNKWWLSKLYTVRQVAEEGRWVVRLISATLLLYLVIVDVEELIFSPMVLDSLGLLATVLFILSSFKFRVVATTEGQTAYAGGTGANASTEPSTEDN